MESTDLSMEQQFKLRVLSEQVQRLSREQAQEYLMEVMRQMMVKDNIVKNLLIGQGNLWQQQNG
ncbi:NblA/ycf18 family protein [Synechococcus sp. PCC 7336]|uniref:NblA/ycf18 family protein n=1 Tax=Synechococcus sp. PCC 7336 TaxID=195250 RepID=UPI000348839F|nr:NblA/ycf18 family protein [Synechococcus sp. PCC 7336]